MIAAAVIAIAINVYIGRGLHQHSHENLNARAVSLHVLGDIGASAGVVIGALAILVTGATWVDPLVSVAIAVIIAAGAVRIVRETMNILLEATPRRIVLPQLIADIRRIAGIRDVHDLHVWTIASGVVALSCHAIIEDVPPSGSAPILDRINTMLHDRYQITHATIQFESSQHSSHESDECACAPECRGGLYCDLRLEETHSHSHGVS